MSFKMKYIDDFMSTTTLSFIFGMLLFIAITSSFTSAYILKITESGQTKVEKRMENINI